MRSKHCNKQLEGKLAESQVSCQEQTEMSGGGHGAQALLLPRDEVCQVGGQKNDTNC